MQPSRIHLLPGQTPTGPKHSTSVRLYVDDTLCIERTTLLQVHIPLHYHDCYEIEFMLSGHAENHLLDHCFAFERGAMAALSQAEVHRLTCEVRCELLSIKLAEPREEENALLQALTFPFCAHLHEETLVFVDKHLLLLEEELASAPENLKPLLARNFISWLLPFVLADARPESLPTSLQRNRVLLGLQYIRRHFREPITLHDVASHCGYSDNHFGLRFRQMTGSSFRQTLCALRLRNAAVLLTQTALSIAEVGAQSGFDSPAYFTRCFADAYGCTPGEYRQTH